MSSQDEKVNGATEETNNSPGPDSQSSTSSFHLPTSNIGRWRRLLARLHHLRGIAHRTVGNYQGDRREHRAAVACFTQALQLDPDFVPAWYDRAALLWRELDDGAAAERDLTRVLELEPDRAEAHFQRAFARQQAGDLAGAIADFERYLQAGHDRLWQQISREQLELLRTLLSPPQPLENIRP